MDRMSSSGFPRDVTESRPRRTVRGRSGSPDTVPELRFSLSGWQDPNLRRLDPWSSAAGARRFA